jgi:hypothetical protein
VAPPEAVREASRKDPGELRRSDATMSVISSGIVTGRVGCQRPLGPIVGEVAAPSLTSFRVRSETPEASTASRSRRTG